MLRYKQLSVFCLGRISFSSEMGSEELDSLNAVHLFSLTSVVSGVIFTMEMRNR